jgi:hypothetical protein
MRILSDRAAGEPIRHDAERFPLARAGGPLRRPSGIGEIRSPAAPVLEPDVPDGADCYIAKTTLFRRVRTTNAADSQRRAPVPGQSPKV